MGEKLENKTYETLLDIYVHEYREVEEIWRLIPPAQWAMYEAFENIDLREQLLLKMARQNLKNIFIRNIYDATQKARKKGLTENPE